MRCSPQYFRTHSSSVLLTAAMALVACGEEPTTPSLPRSDVPSLAVAGAGSWTPKASLPTPRAGMATAVLRNSSGQYLFYSIGGNNDANRAMQRVDVYNAATDRWTRVANLPADRNGATAAAIGTKIYVVGGSNLAGTATRSLYVYNQASNTWTQKASFPSGSGDISGVIAGKLYLVTSVSSSEQRLYRYNPATNVWTRLADPTKNHGGGVGGVIDGKLYVAWGRSHTVDVYDPATNRWTTRLTYAYGGGADGQGSCPPLTEIDCSVRGAASAVFQRQLYVMGGGNDDSVLRGTLAYNPDANAWTDKADMHVDRASPGAGKVFNAAGQARIFVAGGFSTDFASGETVVATEMYTP
jgi:N-acetylneuraminic acid mutarotase